MSDLPSNPNQLKESVKEVGVALKVKMNEVKAKGHKLIDRAKSEAEEVAKKIKQASERLANTKIAIMARAAFQKSLNRIERWRLLPVKKIVCINIAGDISYLYGYVEERIGGTIAVKDAYLLGYNPDNDFIPVVSYEEPIEADFVGTPIIPKSSVAIILDTSALGRKHLDSFIN